VQIDFGYLGLIPAGEGRRRKLHALVFTACFSRFMFVYLTFSMTLEEVIAGCEDAWAYFGGVFAVVIPDNMSQIVVTADAVNPRLTREWLEYAQARVRHPRGIKAPDLEAGRATAPAARRSRRPRSIPGPAPRPRRGRDS
jgi:hypothetical protein